LILFNHSFIVKFVMAGIVYTCAVFYIPNLNIT
jgi:hypothetical protein